MVCVSLYAALPPNSHPPIFIQGFLLVRPPNVYPFRASGRRQIEARRAGKGRSLGKRRNKELAPA